jgi:hypothetical protein
MGLALSRHLAVTCDCILAAIKNEHGGRLTLAVVGGVARQQAAEPGMSCRLGP